MLAPFEGDASALGADRPHHVAAGDERVRPAPTGYRRVDRAGADEAELLESRREVLHLLALLVRHAPNAILFRLPPESNVSIQGSC